MPLRCSLPVSSVISRVDMVEGVDFSETNLFQSFGENSLIFGIEEYKQAPFFIYKRQNQHFCKAESFSSCRTSL